MSLLASLRKQIRQRPGGARLVELVGALVAARGSSLSLVRGRGAGDMMVDGDSRGRAVSGRPVFCGQRCAGARSRHGAFGSRPEALRLIEERWTLAQPPSLNVEPV